MRPSWRSFERVYLPLCNVGGPTRGFIEKLLTSVIDGSEAVSEPSTDHGVIIQGDD